MHRDSSSYRAQYTTPPPDQIKETLFIHEPARLVLLTTLAAVKKADFAFSLNSTELSKGNLSVQMTRLQEKGLVTMEK